MTFQEQDTVVLDRDLPEHDLRRGDLGAIVHATAPDCYEVEFLTEAGQTQSLVSLTAADLWRVEIDPAKIKIRIPVQAELVVEAESEEAIQRWLYSFTFTDACTDDCLYGFRIANGVVTAELRYDPVQVRASLEKFEPNTA